MYIAQTHSTNTLMRERYLDEANLFTIRTGYQTAGRGQQGNGWESEEGKNLLFSTLLKDPPVSAEYQFRISMAVSVALFDAVTAIASPLRHPLAIKWPNDLYAGDEKLSGMLIENILAGNRISRSIIGVGLNVNQTVWTGNAPNPTSLLLQTGNNTDMEALLESFLSSLPLRLASPETTRTLYMQRLYRREGRHLYQPREVSLQPTMNAPLPSEQAFEAEIADVTDNGELVLQLHSGEKRTFHFKQIRYVIENHSSRT